MAQGRREKHAGANAMSVVQEIVARSNFNVKPDYRVKELLELRGIIWSNAHLQE